MIWEATGEKNTVSLEAETTGAVLEVVTKTRNGTEQRWNIPFRSVTKRRNSLLMLRCSGSIRGSRKSCTGEVLFIMHLNAT